MATSSIRAAFLAQLRNPAELLAVFEHLPETYCFIKNRESRMIAASATILARLGLARETDFIERRDHDVFPRALADAYVADDAEVFRTGRPLVNRLELWLDEQGRPEWCVTTKIPLHGKDGEVVGLIGVTRRDLGRDSLRPAAEVTRAVQFVREQVARIVTTRELAEAAGVSERSLNRKINAALGVSPYELVLRVRVQMAAEALLASGGDIAGIAQAHGFCDQSAFTQHFRRRMGVTPKQFLKQRGAARARASSLPGWA
jgi:AraC-like DNA-binding protein